VKYAAGEPISKQSKSANIIPQQFATPLLSTSGWRHGRRYGSTPRFGQCLLDGRKRDGARIDLCLFQPGSYCFDPASGSELRIANPAAQTRMVSPGDLWAEKKKLS
jgi:hypothetical protein